MISPPPPLIQMESHIKKFFNALSIFETLLPRNMYVHHVQVFLFITSKHSVTYREIEKKFQVTNASASRTVHTLAENPPRHRKNCLKLVEIYIDPEEGRRYRVRVNAAGKALYKSMDFLE